MKKLLITILICVAFFMCTKNLNLLSLLEFYTKGGLGKTETDAMAMAPPSYKVDFYIQKYAHKYRVPVRFIYECARLETGFEGKRQWSYYPYQSSGKGAYGVLQVQVATAQMMFPNVKVTRRMLLYDVEFNVHAAIKYMKYLYDREHSWLKVYSMYNQGEIGASQINNYAKTIIRRGK